MLMGKCKVKEATNLFKTLQNHDALIWNVIDNHEKMQHLTSHTVLNSVMYNFTSSVINLVYCYL